MKTKIKIQSISAWSIGIALILTVVFVVILHYGKNEVKRFEDATDQYIVCENAARQLQDGSDYLTAENRHWKVLKSILTKPKLFSHCNRRWKIQKN